MRDIKRLMHSVLVNNRNGWANAAVVTAPGDTTRPARPLRRVLLKDMAIPQLPAPYYHFDYNSADRVETASFASGFSRYDVTYDGGRIKTMTSNIIVNRDTLEYEYDAADRVTMVKYVTPSGLVYTILFFAYDDQKLTRLERFRRLEGGGFVVDRMMSFSYYPDGNLRERCVRRLSIGEGEEEMTMVDHFEGYDDGINVDSFSLLHDEFFDHLLLLPGVQLQKGNPGRVTLTGGGAHYTIEYRYVYDDRRRPVAKNGELRFLTGPQAGARFERNAQFSYY